MANVVVAYPTNPPQGVNALDFAYPIGVEMIWAASGWPDNLHALKPQRIALSNTLVAVAQANNYDRIHIRSTNHPTTNFNGAVVPCPPHVTFIPAHVYLNADLSLTQPAPPANAANGVNGQNPQLFAAMLVVRADGTVAEVQLNNAPRIPPAAGVPWI
ncbi:predicted protein [Sclerotinia sclerotiorum 1980 UF-70]|uniref:Uncharacterized protein n=1 Tax=Sclerotinia sclerotiorum (strain ATCC 18683 / 1980 / Ss-1) TaxID=665079 RepID=A7F600_SCLS1|nr:predicted protein [Sclerotinia sclerotiorum 1980 UF-70]EDN98171.1 predicted protein [Sclerotinia sclerotiorum 1980 UF-70]